MDPKVGKSNNRPRIICRIKGGLGNQLFCYAAARRLALVNNCELLIDDVSGFKRDHQYQRKFALNQFCIPVRKATPSERLEPFDRYRRGLLKLFSRRKPFEKRIYLEQEGLDFDERLLELRVEDSLYLDGLWQSEGYFKDVESTIREDLKIMPPSDSLNQDMAEKIRKSNAVAVHVRWFDAADSMVGHNVSAEYYQRAIESIESKVEAAHYFLFSDDLDAARAIISLPETRVTYVSHNEGDENAYADLWLMTQCQYFIIANSTFSWWGAWLAEGKKKIVLSPDLCIDGKAAWGFKGLIPDEWLKV